MSIKVYKTDGVIFTDGNEVKIPEEVVSLDDYKALKEENLRLITEMRRGCLNCKGKY